MYRIHVERAHGELVETCDGDGPDLEALFESCRRHLDEGPGDPVFARTAPVRLTLFELGGLTAALWPMVERRPVDPIARALWLKLRRAAESLGVVWRYGGPEPEDDKGGA